VNILLAFVPFLTFALLERSVGAHVALLAATVVSALLVIRDTVIRHKSLKLLEGGSLALFAVLTIASRFPQLSTTILSDGPGRICGHVR
jgi:hypothetical protein